MSEWSCGIYVASRASVLERGAMWRKLRADGWPIIATWIDEDGPGQTPSMGALWERILVEVLQSCGVVLYVEPSDLPLKGAFIEVGAALGAGLPVAFVAPGMSDLRPIGSWTDHPRVKRYDTVEEALASMAPKSPKFIEPRRTGICSQCLEVMQLQADGTIALHTVSSRAFPCSGSGKTLFRDDLLGASNDVEVSFLLGAEQAAVIKKAAALIGISVSNYIKTRVWRQAADELKSAHESSLEYGDSELEAARRAERLTDIADHARSLPFRPSPAVCTIIERDCRPRYGPKNPCAAGPHPAGEAYQLLAMKEGARREIVRSAIVCSDCGEEVAKIMKQKNSAFLTLGPGEEVP